MRSALAIVDEDTKGPCPSPDVRTPLPPPLRQRGWRVERWRASAACAAMGPDLFFPIGEYGDDAQEDIRNAQAVCLRCPVRFTA